MPKSEDKAFTLATVYWIPDWPVIILYTNVVFFFLPLCLLFSGLIFSSCLFSSFFSSCCCCLVSGCRRCCITRQWISTTFVGYIGIDEVLTSIVWRTSRNTHRRKQNWANTRNATGEAHRITKILDFLFSFGHVSTTKTNNENIICNAQHHTHTHTYEHSGNPWSESMAILCGLS